MKSELDFLLTKYALPSQWTTPELYATESKVGDVTFHRIGLLARRDNGAVVTGSAVELESFPLRRAFFELLERLSIVEAETNQRSSYAAQNHAGETRGELSVEIVFPKSPNPDRWLYSRSNGIAAHVERIHACTAAKGELFERDAVLRSWYGETIPENLTIPSCLIPEGLRAKYDFEAYRFPTAARDSVVGVFAFPRAHGMRGMGFGCKASVEEAVISGLRECYQTMGFLCEEPLREREPDFAPSPGFHQEAFMTRQGIERLRRWLREGHPRKQRRLPIETNETLFVELTPDFLAGKLYVVKALEPSRLPLIFGRFDGYLGDGVPLDLWAHPIA